MISEIQQLEKAISELESKRAILGDQTVDTALKPMRLRLQELQSTNKTGEQLKFVTILFVDITGSTQIAQYLDPEDLKTILSGGLDIYRTIVEKHGGSVTRFLGDGFMAIFGMLAAREDDAERAVKAGLEMIQAAQIYSQEVERTWAITGYNIRVGINSGQVILGGELEETNLAIGMTIHVASRIESAAPIGGLLITHNTYRNVKGLFKVVPQPLLKVKGRDQPVRSYLVEGALPRPDLAARRGVEGFTTPLIGREPELEQLARVYRSSLKSGGTTLVTIVGDPGVGKSRLVQTYLDRLEGSQGPVPILFSRATQQMTDVPYHLLREMINDHFNIQDSDPLPVLHNKLEEGMRESLGEDAVLKAHFIGALLGYNFSTSPYLKGILNDPKLLRERGLQYLHKFYSSLAGEKGAILVFDDIHWGDELSLVFIEELAKVAGSRLFILCLTRPDLLERYPNWGTEGLLSDTYQERIYLDPLTRTASQELMRALMREVEAVPPRLWDIVIRNSDGNPYYIEEFINMLIDDQVIVQSVTGPGWRVDETKLQSIQVPSTLMAVLQARLDSLPAEERSLLQKASVAGRIFWDGLLAAMNLWDQAPTELIDSLCDRDLIYPHGDQTFEDADGFIFKHALLQEVAYQSLLKRDRRQYHLVVADWLVHMTRGLSGTVGYSSLIAEHYEGANQNDAAADWYSSAAKLAKKQGAFTEAQHFLERAVGLHEPQNLELEWQILLELSEVHEVLGNMDARQADNERMIAISSESQDPAQLAEAYYRLGNSSYHKGKYHEAVESYDRAILAAEKSRLDSIRSQALSLKVICLARLGKHDQAALTAEEALSLSRSMIDDTALARTLTNLANYFDESGDIGSAVELIRQQVAINHRIGNQMGEAIGLSNLGYNYVLLGQYQIAIQTLKEALHLCNIVEDQRTSAYTQLNLALAHYRNGEYTIARDLLLSAFSCLETLGDLFGVAAGHSYLGLVYESIKNLQEAQAEYQNAVDMFNKIGAISYANDALTGLARCSMASGDLNTAEGYISRVCDYLKTNGAVGMELPIWSYKTCAEIYYALDMADRAQQAVKDGYNELTDRADLISDREWREAFLMNVPDHKAIIDLWHHIGSTPEEKIKNE